MTNMQRYKVIDDDLMRPDEPPHGIVPDAVFIDVVLASDAEAAIAAARADMLAKCIHKVSLYLHEEICNDTCRGYCAALDDVIRALRGLIEGEQA